MRPSVHVFPDIAALSDALARRIAESAGRALAERPRFSFVLTGGSMLGALYERLSRFPPSELAWRNVHLFWGDDRFVPPGHPDSNFRLARETLLDRAAIPPANVHAIPTTEASPAAAAAAYEREIRAFLADGPGFDLVLLGIGEDGHVASLFPGSRQLEERDKWVVGVTDSPKPPPQRVTLTLPAINSAGEVHFLAAGPAKADAIRGALKGPELPAGRVHARSGDVTWWLERAAAARIAEGKAGDAESVKKDK